MDTAQLLLELIRFELQGAPVEAEELNTLDEEQLCELYRLADAHDLAHVVGSALSKLGKRWNNQVSTDFQKKSMMAVFRHEGLQYEQNRIYETLEKARIPFIPLKGAIIRNFYPQPWMRTSCDIDILVQEADLDRAILALQTDLGYKWDEKRQYHDVNMFAPSGVHLELHFSIKEDEEQLDAVLDRVWDYAAPSSPDSFQYKLTDAYFLFHIITHAAYHFINGGCGVRPLIDLWLLEKNLTPDEKELTGLLQEVKLATFYESLKNLYNVWLEGQPHTPVTMQMQAYILHGGVYGKNSNRVALRLQRKGGPLGYALYKIFLPLEKLKSHYPILKKHPWLMPVMQVRRWFKLIFCGHTNRIVKELSYNQSVSQEDADEMKAFLKDIGLI
ncbi:MAG: nucleotidyltransferase family protein [Oscillospiraceae bacterium]|nr:nucleotidyltransferase family protein [Oscillospiraceae bacterium]